MMIDIPDQSVQSGSNMNINPGDPESPASQFLNVAYKTNLLLNPSGERQTFRLTPMVMPNVAGFCDWCGKCYEQIVLQLLGDYLIAREHDGETV